MIVALISDVHGNLPALEAVVKDARRHEAVSLWNAGDHTGYGPFSEEVLNLIQQENMTAIAGNYDSKVLAFEKKRDKWRHKKAPLKFTAFEWAWEHLSADARDYLRTLPEDIHLDIDGFRVLLTHGSPASKKEPLGPQTPLSHLKELADLVDCDIIACGHSHEPFSRLAGGVLFVNPGSVGRSFGNDPRASYALLHFQPGEIIVQLRFIHYDIDRLLQALKDNNLHPEFTDLYLVGNAPWDDETQTTVYDHPSLLCHRKKDKSRMQTILDVAQAYAYEPEHAGQVCRLALRLFDELQSLLQMGEQERFFLICGAILHDIGTEKPEKGHHEHTQEIILGQKKFPFQNNERNIIGCIARYHRRQRPDLDHPEFARLDALTQQNVSTLAGIVKLADGLDASHENRIKNLTCKIKGRKIIIKCQSAAPAHEEQTAADRKSDLLTKSLQRDVKLIFNL
ncbi:MAG: YfcE family phosphodiesterase [Sedimentisphaerales bacterium]|nr:YfcE family phosphodiesterase [Sedimentisphaerales bacterium]